MNKQDARYLAQTVNLLTVAQAVTDPPSDGTWRNTVEDAITLHRIAGSIHRYDERVCSVEMSEAETARVERRVTNLEAKARAIATAYGFRAYFQGDCRGCPLYLIPESVVPVFGIDTGTPEDAVASHAVLQARWIDSNYSSAGHAVPWLG